MSAKLNILVSGMIAGDPGQGGATWAVLQYVLGLRSLGHEVFLIEPVAEVALQPAGCRLGQSKNAEYFHQVVADFGLEERAALLIPGTKETCGLSFSRLRQIGERTDVLINIAGMLMDERLTRKVPIRVYLDLDPAFTQLWQAVQGIDMRLGNHTHHVTIGLNIGDPGCLVPTCGLTWIKTLQPIALANWPETARVARNALTTVANWRGYGSIEHEGVLYGQKAHSLREFFELPTMTEEEFCLAMAIHPAEKADLHALHLNHWHLIAPQSVAATPHHYQRFIQGSKAEFGIAKSGYVHSRCGWFSDRSVCYLASGKPVMAQDTGSNDYLPNGQGLFFFKNVTDVLTTIESLNEDYLLHAQAARSIAEDLFAADRVLPKLLAAIGC